jgi:hypothetical protein
MKFGGPLLPALCAATQGRAERGLRRFNIAMKAFDACDVKGFHRQQSVSRMIYARQLFCFLWDEHKTGPMCYMLLRDNASIALLRMTSNFEMTKKFLRNF